MVSFLRKYTTLLSQRLIVEFCRRKTSIIIIINVVHEVQNKYKHKRKAKRKTKKIEKQKTWQLQRHSTHKYSIAALQALKLIIFIHQQW